jgi:hypothetical protein
LVFGLLRPRVLIPERLVEQLSDDELRMVLAHEAAHVRRRDAVASLYMFVCFVLFYFHPAVWLARREWQLDREAACDGAAIDVTGAEARGYAAMLLKVSAGADRAPVLALSAVPTYWTLQRRINEMKQDKKNLRSGRVVWALLAVLVSAGALPVVLTQRKPHFGAGVFETKWPDVKVSQALKSEKTLDELPAVAVAAGPSSLPPVATAELPEQATAVAVGPIPLVQVAPAGSAGNIPAERVPTLAPSGVAVGAAPGRQATTLRPGVATELPTGTRVGPVSTGSTSPTLAVGASTTAGPSQVGAVGGVAAPVKSSGASTAEVIAPALSTVPSSVTIVLRDKKSTGGTGLDTPVSIELEDVAVVDFFKFLSSVTGVRIKVAGVRSGMRLNAQIENATLGEVMGTLAKVYGLEWRLGGDGSISVQPFRK